jgi:predicted MFS family arabinose efflux permease
MNDHQSRLFTLPYIILMITNLLIALGYSMISTLISSYAIQLGATLTTAGVLAGIFSIAALLFRPFSGAIADRLNKKYCVLISAVLIFVNMLGYAFASGISWLYAVRVFHGVAFGLNSTVSMALVSEFIPKKRITEGLGYWGIGQIAAQVIGPTLGTAVMGSVGYHALFFITAGLTLLSVLLLLGLPHTHQPAPARKVGEPKKFRGLIALECVGYSLVGGMFSLTNGIATAFLVPLGAQRGIGNISLFFTVNGLVLLAMRMLIGKVIDRISLTAIVTVSLILTAASMVTAGLAQGLGLILLAAALKAIGQGGGQISLQSACLKMVEPWRVGIAAGTYYIGADIGQGLGPMIGGQLSSVFGYTAMFYCIAGILLVTLFLFILQQRKESRNRAC